MSADHEPRSEGLRERKKRLTRGRIQRAALALFLEKGYPTTTMEEIARVADVSPSTLFNYFPTKQSLVTDDYDPLLIPLLRSRPLDEPIFTAIRRAIEEGFGAIIDEDRDLLMARAKLVLAIPDLRAAARLDRDRSVRLLREILAERYGGSPDDFELKVTSAVICSAMESAMEEWLESDGKPDLMKLIGSALDIAESGARVRAQRARRGTGRRAGPRRPTRGGHR